VTPFTVYCKICQRKYIKKNTNLSPIATKFDTDLRIMVLCTYCEKTCSTPKHCSVCKSVVYCSIECQRQSWINGHKTLCNKVGDFNDVMAKIKANANAKAIPEWKLALLLIPHVDVMLSNHTPDRQIALLNTLLEALREYGLNTWLKNRMSEMIPLLKKLADIEGQIQRFRDQGETFVRIADCCNNLEDYTQAIDYFQRARKVGEAHGFFRLESEACRGLGELFLKDGRLDEGMGLLRNAVAAAPLAEGDTQYLEVVALNALLSSVLMYQPTWDDEKQKEMKELALKYCVLSQLILLKDQNTPHPRSFVIVSFFTLARVLRRIGDASGVKDAMEGMLSSVQNTAQRPEVHAVYRHIYGEQVENAIEFIAIYFEDEREWDDLVNDFKIELRKSCQ
jgi:tetratricopeptide (TPR) repeat protein